MALKRYVYALLFSAELVLRVGAGGPRIFCNEEWMWSWLDLFIVATSIWEVVVDTLQAVTDGARVSGVGGLSSVKAFRIVRLTRIPVAQWHFFAGLGVFHCNHPFYLGRRRFSQGRAEA